SIQPNVTQEDNGPGDMNFGFKYAFLYDATQVATLQFRATAPTGDPGKGLGTHDWWLEPGLLYYRQLGERLALEAGVRDYIPIPTDQVDDGWPGNVLRYGVGLEYVALRTCKFSVTPVVEVVGWTCLGGGQTDPFSTIPPGFDDVTGTTIVNGKFGVRVG